MSQHQRRIGADNTMESKLTAANNNAKSEPLAEAMEKPSMHNVSVTLPRTTASRVGIVDEALRVEKYLYTHLLELTQRQTQAIEAQDTDGLLRLLSARQQLVDRLVAQHKCFQPYRNVWTQLIDGFDDATRIRIDAALDELRTMAQAVADADDAAAQTLGARKGAVQNELLGARRTRIALSAYCSPKTGNTTRFQDTQA